ncbi:MAG: hypothetical protein IKV87_05030 [Methanobrevibacter sp.]|nr:hypothetical protein [Methanobrevibacter sp.]
MDFGIIGLVLLISFVSSILIGFSNSKLNVELSRLILKTIIYGVCVLILSILSIFYNKILLDFLLSYCLSFFIIFGLILLYLGISIVKDFKKYRENYIVSNFIRILNFVVVLIMTTYIIGLVSLYTGLSGFNLLILGIISAVILSLGILLTYRIFSKRSFEKTKTLIDVANLELSFGFVFFLLGILLPNVNGLFKASNPINIESVYSLVLILFAGIILIGIGYLINKKTTSLK